VPRAALPRFARSLLDDRLSLGRRIGLLVIGIFVISDYLFGTVRVTASTPLKFSSCEDNFLAIRKRRFVPQTTDSGHDFEVALNVARRLIPTAVSQLWVADITYVRLARVDVFLAVVMDAFSRRIVGWNLAPTITTELTLTALSNAIESRRPLPGLIHSLRSRSSVCVDRVRRHVASARHDSEHEQAGQPLR